MLVKSPPASSSGEDGGGGDDAPTRVYKRYKLSEEKVSPSLSSSRHSDRAVVVQLPLLPRETNAPEAARSLPRQVREVRHPGIPPQAWTPPPRPPWNCLSLPFLPSPSPSPSRNLSGKDLPHQSHGPTHRSQCCLHSLGSHRDEPRADGHRLRPILRRQGALPHLPSFCDRNLRARTCR
jgi:hypothetical protein